MPRRNMLKMESQAYRSEYIQILEGHGVEKIEADLERLNQIAGAKALVLLCFEDLRKERKWCHRRMFADWWTAQTGVPVPELAPAFRPNRCNSRTSGGRPRKRKRLRTEPSTPPRLRLRPGPPSRSPRWTPPAPRPGPTACGKKPGLAGDHDDGGAGWAAGGWLAASRSRAVWAKSIMCCHTAATSLLAGGALFEQRGPLELLVGQGTGSESRPSGRTVGFLAGPPSLPCFLALGHRLLLGRE
jgi:hypothetical protein